MSAVFEPRVRGTVPVIWYVMAPGASSPVGLAAEPGEAGVDLPVDIWEWAQANGVDAHNNPDVYMLVTTEPNPGWIAGALAARDGEVSPGDAARIDESRAQAEDLAREERTGREGCIGCNKWYPDSQQEER